MKKIGKNCKLAKYVRYLWETSQTEKLEDVYKSYSYCKKKAYDYCVNLMHSLEGHSLKIISHNCMVFSVAFVFDDENGKTYLVYITRDYERYFEI